MNEIVDIYLDLSEPASQSIKVTLKWIPRSKSLQWSLPIWTPGSYTIREHVQHLHSLNLKQDSKLVPVQRVSSSGWKTELDSLEPLSLNYVIEARQLTVRTCYLDPDFSSLCLAAAVVEIGSHRWSTHRLNVVVPDGWNTYIPLTGEEIFIADDYDQLVDAPLHAGCFQSTPFTVNKNNHQLICIGAPPMGWPSDFLEDISDICCATCHLMDGPPPAGDRYQLVIQMLDRGYGGLEHDYGAVLQYSWNSLGENDGYRKLLQLIGHEYLHQWNVRRLRPSEYRPYDYTKAVVSDSLWFAEGVTSYFDLTLPFLAKLSDRLTLLKDLSAEFSPLLTKPGRRYQTLADSSREAWVKLYKSNPANSDIQVSYYRLGAAIAFCLDVRLRQYDSSLASILRSLWLKFGRTARGYSRLDIKAAIAEVEPTLASDLDVWLDQLDSLPLESVVNDIGLKLEPIKSTERQTGLTLFQREGLIKITSVSFGSHGHQAGLVVGDELIAVGGFRLSHVDEMKTLLPEDPSVTITYSRRGRLRETTIGSDPPGVDHWIMTIDDQAPTQASKLREQWFQII